MRANRLEKLPTPDNVSELCTPWVKPPVIRIVSTSVGLTTSLARKSLLYQLVGLGPSEDCAGWNSWPSRRV